MFQFDISLSALGIKKTLPNINKWLNPKYDGPGDEMVKSLAGMINSNPENYAREFPEYVYVIDENMQIKHQLNETKNQITKIKEEGYDKIYTAVAAAFNKYESLRGKRGILAQQYGAEIVSNAWMKMYESMNLIDVMKTKTTKEFTSFHIAEAPGNFILAINQYMFSHYPKIHWNWFASSYVDEFGSKEGKYLEDNYGIMRNYPDKWIYGADGNGDITSSANIESFAEIFPNNLDFMTSDVKYVPLVEDYNEEENQNIPVNFGHTIIALRTLRKGGSALLKEFTFMESPKICQLFLLSCVFKTVKIIKPVTSRPANSEVYILCKDYKANLSELQMQKLMKYMLYIRFLTNGSPALFKLEDIPEKFISAIIELNKLLSKQQTTGILRNVELVYAYKNTQVRDIYENSKTEERTAAAEKWIVDVGIQHLPDNKRMIRAVNNPVNVYARNSY